MKKIVVIGGGTGTFTVLSGLRDYPFELSAIVSTVDDGGSTGILRDELGVLPPGDVRQALVALSDQSKVMRDLLNYRFEEGGLKGHNFGNLLLSALEKVTGSFDQAVLEAGKILAIKGRVIPVTNDQVELVAETQTGKTIKGQHAIDEFIWAGSEPIKRVSLDKACSIHPQAKQAIKKADMIVIAPGSIFTSLIPNFLVEGVVDAIRASKAPVTCVANLMTEKGQTQHYFVQDFITLLEEYIGPKNISYVVHNTAIPSKDLLERYKKEMERIPVRLDRKRCDDLSYRLVGAKLLNGKPTITKDHDMLSQQRTLIRHNPQKLAHVLQAILLMKDIQPYFI